MHIRPMRSEEVALAVEWAAQEGWNPGVHDAQSFAAADPAGFLIGVVDGEPVAVISAVRYGQTFAFLGFYIVAPSWRGKGYGLQIWNAAMARLASRTVGLDGVVAQQENYNKSGFVLAYRNIRYEGISTGESRSGEGTVVLGDIAFETLEAYDCRFFPAARDAFLHAWIAQPGATALGLAGEEGLRGYGVIRPCRSGFKIGPLFADDAETAEILFGALAAAVPAGERFYLDIPEPNPQARALVQRHGMSVVFETARMYAGDAPQLPVGQIFGVTSFELG
jgi:GNAT superfamily N-acetyltransferase